MAICSWITHKKCFFSVAMLKLVYQRLHTNKINRISTYPKYNLYSICNIIHQSLVQKKTSTSRTRRFDIHNAPPPKSAQPGSELQHLTALLTSAFAILQDGLVHEIHVPWLKSQAGNPPAIHVERPKKGFHQAGRQTLFCENMDDSP